MMNQKCQDGRQKTMMFYCVKTDTKMTEEICNTSCYQIRSTNNHLCQNEETSYVNCFHLQTTNFIIIDTNLLTSPEFTTISHTYIADLQPKNRIYVPQPLLTYLCSYTSYYSTLIQSSRRAENS